MSITNKTKKVTLMIVTLIILAVSTLYFKYTRLEVYEWKDSLVIKNNTIYEYSPNLSNKYAHGELETEKTVGRFKGDHFLGFKTWVNKLEDISEEDAFLVRGLMFEGVYIIKDQ